MASSRHLTLLLSVLALIALAAPASAAALITVGQNGELAKLGECASAEGRDEAQVAVAEGASYTVSSAGLLTSWTSSSKKTGSIGLKVFRPVAGSFFVLAAEAPKLLPAMAPQTFPVSIPVQPGDLVGVHYPPFAGVGCEFKTELPGDVHRYQLKQVAPGGTVTLPSSTAKSRLNISATLLAAPAISSLAPSFASITGGPVAITGSGFDGVTAVSFGATPLAFKVESETRITATIPPSPKLGAAPITVTNPAGTATSAQLFNYTACVVPKVKGRMLKASRKLVRRTSCGLGRLTKRRGATAKTGEVVKQVPPPGSVVAPGTTIRLTLAPR